MPGSTATMRQLDGNNVDARSVAESSVLGSELRQQMTFLVNRPSDFDLAWGADGVAAGSGYHQQQMAITLNPHDTLDTVTSSYKRAAHATAPSMQTASELDHERQDSVPTGEKPALKTKKSLGKGFAWFGPAKTTESEPKTSPQESPEQKNFNWFGLGSRASRRHKEASASDTGPRQTTAPPLPPPEQRPDPGLAYLVHHQEPQYYDSKHEFAISNAAFPTPPHIAAPRVLYDVVFPPNAYNRVWLYLGNGQSERTVFPTYHRIAPNTSNLTPELVVLLRRVYNDLQHPLPDVKTTEIGHLLSWTFDQVRKSVQTDMQTYHAILRCILDASTADRMARGPPKEMVMTKGRHATELWESQRGQYRARLLLQRAKEYCEVVGRDGRWVDGLERGLGNAVRRMLVGSGEWMEETEESAGEVGELFDGRSSRRG